MREMLLSVKPYVYEKIASGTKIFEHRRNFPNEPIKAYLYVSSPVCAIKGIIILKNRHSLAEWKEQFANDLEAVKRIEEFAERARYAVEIHEFIETNEIPLNRLRQVIDCFVVPQMYYFIDNKPIKKYLDSNLSKNGKRVVHNFELIESDMVCRH